MNLGHGRDIQCSPVHAYMLTIIPAQATKILQNLHLNEEIVGRTAGIPTFLPTYHLNNI